MFVKKAKLIPVKNSFLSTCKKGFNEFLVRLKLLYISGPFLVVFQPKNPVIGVKSLILLRFNHPNFQKLQNFISKIF